MSETAKPVEPVSLTTAHIMQAVQCIDIAAENGAYKGWAVIENVLRTRLMLLAFLRANAPEVLAANGYGPPPAAPSTSTGTKEII